MKDNSNLWNYNRILWWGETREMVKLLSWLSTNDGNHTYHFFHYISLLQFFSSLKFFCKYVILFEHALMAPRPPSQNKGKHKTLCIVAIVTIFLAWSSSCKISFFWEAYIELNRTFMLKLFCKNNRKLITVDAQLGSKWASTFTLTVQTFRFFKVFCSLQLILRNGMLFLLA